MTDETQMTKAELLANIEQGWNNFQAYLSSLTYEQVTIPTDPAGWTAKDHIAHLAIWEDSLNALLEKKSRREHMGIADEAIWNNGEWDAVNAIIQQRYHDLPLRDLATMFFGIHEKLVGKINALSDTDLQRSYREFQPDAEWDAPIIHWMIIDTYEHYDEHQDYIDIIAQSRPSSVPNVLESIKAGWDTLNTYLDSLSDTQLTHLTDATGWTVKDHVIHLAVWEDGIYALLEHRSRVEQMGIDDATWERGEINEINGIIQQQYHNLAWAEVQQKRQQIHQRLVDKIASMTDEDLQHPYRDYEAASTEDEPVLSSIAGNTFGHYAEHQPWIERIVTSNG
ncbi:MAG: ClbS/DfsB family four-helix bundle protein [Chloroflexi bacterium]|nr:ClbS/DfsB family four-helix bundle protein [Chloroflexota bacterium]